MDYSDVRDESHGCVAGSPPRGCRQGFVELRDAGLGGLWYGTYTSNSSCRRNAIRASNGFKVFRMINAHTLNNFAAPPSATAFRMKHPVARRCAFRRRDLNARVVYVCHDRFALLPGGRA